jgi:putative ABC transport system permease protein
MAALALSISIILYTLLLPSINEMIGKPLPISYITDKTLLVILISIFALVVITGSVYPIFYSIRSSALTGLKGFSSLSNNRLRKVLTIGQLTFTAGLVFFTLTVNNQVSFLRNKDFGFSSNNIVMMSLPKEVSIGNGLTTLTNNLRKDNLIDEVSLINELSYPGSERIGYQLGWIYNNDNKIEANFNVYEVDSLFTKLLEMNFLAGSSFVSQSNEKFKEAIVNNAFVKMAGFDVPASIVGETIHAFDDKIKIVGVVSDFNYQDFQQTVKPLIMIPINLSSDGNKKLLFKLKNPNDLETIENQYLKLLSQSSFEYTFLDDRVNKMFEQEKTTGQITQVFSFVAILLATIGLYSLSTLILSQRTKEIGVRKILGISSGSLTILLSKEFFVLFAISFGVAIPLAWVESQHWLADYAFRTDLKISTIGLSGLIVLTILILGIVTNIFRSAKINPVDLLKNE